MWRDGPCGRRMVDDDGGRAGATESFLPPRGPRNHSCRDYDTGPLPGADIDQEFTVLAPSLTKAQNTRPLGIV